MARNEQLSFLVKITYKAFFYLFSPCSSFSSLHLAEVSVCALANQEYMLNVSNAKVIHLNFCSSLPVPKSWLMLVGRKLLLMEVNNGMGTGRGVAGRNERRISQVLKELS